MPTFVDDADTIPFARRSARYLYRNGLRPGEVAEALADELEVPPAVARTIAIEEQSLQPV